MTTKSNSKTVTKETKTVTPKDNGTEKEVKATSTKNGATQSATMQQIDEILKPNGKAKVKKLQHAQILADKFEKMSNKYDELTHFIAGKDNDNTSMKFASESGYSFTLNNPTVISKVLDVIENEFSNHLENSEAELLNFHI